MPIGAAATLVGFSVIDSVLQPIVPASGWFEGEVGILGRQSSRSCSASRSWPEGAREEQRAPLPPPQKPRRDGSSDGRLRAAASTGARLSALSRPEPNEAPPRRGFVALAVRPFPRSLLHMVRLALAVGAAALLVAAVAVVDHRHKREVEFAAQEDAWFCKHGRPSACRAFDETAYEERWEKS